MRLRVGLRVGRRLSWNVFNVREFYLKKQVLSGFIRVSWFMGSLGIMEKDCE